MDSLAVFTLHSKMMNYFEDRMVIFVICEHLIFIFLCELCISLKSLVHFGWYIFLFACNVDL